MRMRIWNAGLFRGHADRSIRLCLSLLLMLASPEVKGAQPSPETAVLRQAEKCAGRAYDCLGALVLFAGAGKAKSVTHCHPSAKAHENPCAPNELAFVTVKQWADVRKVPSEVVAFSFYRDGATWHLLSDAASLSYVPRDRRTVPSR